MIRKILAYLGVILLCAVLLLSIAPTIFLFSTKSQIFQSTDAVPISQAAVVPGAAILKNGDLSPVLKDRVDKALELYKAHKVFKILVTGNNNSLTYDEVDPVRRYLLKEGVPSADIFLDHAGFDTYSSMYRAQEVFAVESMIIVSQSFHLPRSVYLANNLGMVAYGLNADNGHYTSYNYIREFFADSKALFDLIFSREPKFLGKVIPITGNGEDTLK